MTGKPHTGQNIEKDPFLRWTFNFIVYTVCLLIIVLYLTIIYGSFSTAWGVDFRPTLQWWQQTLTRGVEAILDTTFLSVLATPVAALTGMIIAFLVVRKKFSGKEVLDFGSNLGGAVPGTILGIGFVLAFSTPPWIVVALLYVLLAVFLTRSLFDEQRERWITLGVGSALGLGISLLNPVLGLAGVYYLLGAIMLALGLFIWFGKKQVRLGQVFSAVGLYMFTFDLINYVSQPIATFSRSIPRGFWSNAIFQFSDYLKVIFQLPPVFLAIIVVFGAVMTIGKQHDRLGQVMAIACLMVTSALCFSDLPLALVGTPFIILAAFAVRSLPASVRAGVASLQQIDPSMEEASLILGADSQYTFRKVTLPLILPAFLAGLIFSFTRHMTSLSAIIFLVSARWRIVTASILSEWEQGGVSIAAAYSTVIIVLVMIAIGILYFITNRLMRGRSDVDLSIGL